MATPTKYTFSIASDTANGSVNPSTLTAEIAASAIVIALDHIDTGGDVLDIWFKDALSSNDQTALSTVVSAHQGGLAAPPASPVPVLLSGNSALEFDSLRRLRVAPEPRTGSETIYVSHDFCDKCTWFGDSVRVNNEALSAAPDGLTFSSAHTHWIDMISGRVCDDDGYVEEQQLGNPSDPHGYQVVVKVDGVVKTMREPFEASGGDYEVIWEEGKVVFFSAPSGTVTASYSYATTSSFYLKPLTGMVLQVETAEADFSTDCYLGDGLEYTVFGYVDIFAPQLMTTNGGSIPPGTKIPIKGAKYKRFNSILGEAIGAFPLVPGIGTSTEEDAMSIGEYRRKARGTRYGMQAIPFRYGTVRELASSYGLEIRVRTAHDRELGGHRATVTFYSTVRVEA